MRQEFVSTDGKQGDTHQVWSAALSVPSAAFTRWRASPRASPKNAAQHLEALEELVFPAALLPEEKERPRDSRWKPLLLPGVKNVSSVVCYGGLASTYEPWRVIARRFARMFGCRVVLRNIARHEGEVRALKNLTHEEMVQDIISTMRAEHEVTGRAGVFLGFSTSALAAIEAARRKPELFGAMVLVGTPLRLRNRWHRQILSLLARAEGYVPGLRQVLSQLFVKPGGIPEAYSTLPEEYLQAPKIPKIPLSALTALARLGRKAWRSEEPLPCPVLMICGDDDHFISADDTIAYSHAQRGAELELIIVRGGPHPVMKGEMAEEISTKIISWLLKQQRAGRVNLSRSRVFTREQFFVNSFAPDQLRGQTFAPKRG